MTDEETSGLESALNGQPDARDAIGSAATSEAIIEEVPAKPRRSRRLAKPEQPEETPLKTPTKSEGKGKDAIQQRVLTKEEEDAGMLIKPLLIQGELHLFPRSLLIQNCPVQRLLILNRYPSQSGCEMISGRCSWP